ncbi:MAG: hypothetical protein L0Y54_02780 [Sporichthyaceae bacterium]|nr:hypothetical protein [Sporichthyaceae bacterium]
MTVSGGAAPGSAEPAQVVGHCYTKARRFPLVIGKLPGGGRIPGGPYSLHQIGAMVLAALVLKQTSPLWAHFGPLNLVVFIAVPYGLAFALRHARVDGRSPIWAAVGWLSYLSAPRGGRLRGRPLRPIRTQRQVGRFRFGPVPPDLARSRVPIPAPARPGHRPTPRPALRPGPQPAQRPGPQPAQRSGRRPALAPTGLSQLLDLSDSTH